MVTKIPPHKHIVQVYQTAQNISAAGNGVTLAVGTLNPDPYTNVTNVRNGSIIRQIHLQIDVLWQDSAAHHDSYEWYVWFNINGAQTQPDPQSTNASHLKNQIIHQDGRITSNVVFSSVGIFEPRVSRWRLVINIPRWAQQLNDGDKIELVHRNAVNAAIVDYRIVAIYKEIYP